MASCAKLIFETLTPQLTTPTQAPASGVGSFFFIHCVILNHLFLFLLSNSTSYSQPPLTLDIVAKFKRRIRPRLPKPRKRNVQELDTPLHSPSVPHSTVACL